MKKSEMFGFSLETDNRTEEEKKQQQKAARVAPMDTDYNEEMEETKPQIRFNLNFDKWATPCNDNMIADFFFYFKIIISQVLFIIKPHVSIRVKLLDLLTRMGTFFIPHPVVPYFVCRRIQGKEQSDRKRESETFPIDRLFEAVASRDVRKLEGLHQYLHQNTKKLSDSLCECDRTHNAAAAPNCELLTRARAC